MIIDRVEDPPGILEQKKTDCLNSGSQLQLITIDLADSYNKVDESCKFQKYFTCITPGLPRQKMSPV